MKKTKNLIVTIVSLIFAFAVIVILNYLLLPAFNVKSLGFWVFIQLFLLIFLGFTSLQYVNADYQYYESNIRPNTVVLIICNIFLVVMILICSISGAKMFNAKKYSQQIKIEEGNFEKDIPTIKDSNLESINNIALMDSKTARKFGKRALGSLKDDKVVSQFNIQSEYSQITYHGKPVKVAPLEYGGFFKWLNNKDEGIPGYILVDPVNNTAKYVQLKKNIQYSPSAKFSKNLKRTFRKQYPTKIISNYYFEIDESGNPVWVITTATPTIGVFGNKKIDSCIIFDACTGKSKQYALKDVPDWVDIVFDGDYLTQRIDWNGMYSNGFLNSITSKKGCKRATDDFGYLTIGNDVWMYTGITSASSDSSNIGMILANERTGEIKRYDLSGADEHSAMKAAEGEVQQYEYTASFPSIVNINGELTYIMVLVDNNKIVKNYALVNAENYSKVVVANTAEEAYKLYTSKLGIPDAETTKDAETEDKTFTVDDIKFIVNDGNTTIYIYDTTGKVYKETFDEKWMTIKSGSKVTVKCVKDTLNSDIIMIKEVL